MSEQNENLTDVRERLREIQHAHRGHIRWRITRHTAELTMRALNADERASHRPSAKSRRRKRYKRLL